MEDGEGRGRGPLFGPTRCGWHLSNGTGCYCAGAGHTREGASMRPHGFPRHPCRGSLVARRRPVR